MIDWSKPIVVKLCEKFYPAKRIYSDYVNKYGYSNVVVFNVGGYDGLYTVNNNGMYFNQQFVFNEKKKLKGYIIVFESAGAIATHTYRTLPDNYLKYYGDCLIEVIEKEYEL